MLVSTKPHISSRTSLPSLKLGVTTTTNVSTLPQTCSYITIQPTENCTTLSSTKLFISPMVSTIRPPPPLLESKHAESMIDSEPSVTSHNTSDEDDKDGECHDDIINPEKYSTHIKHFVPFTTGNMQPVIIDSGADCHVGGNIGYRHPSMTHMSNMLM